MASEIEVDFIWKLARSVRDYGIVGKTIGKRSHLLTIATPEKRINIISVMEDSNVAMSISITGDTPKDMKLVDFFQSEEMLVIWDKRISKEEIEIGLRNRITH